MVIELATPHGPARVHLHPAERPIGALLLGHGAGGPVTAKDLVAVTGAALAVGVSVALVEQPNEPAEESTYTRQTTSRAPGATR